MNKSIISVRRCFACAVFLLVYCSSQAQGWEFKPFISVKEVYSDNIEHKHKDLAVEDFVSEVAPGFSALLDSPRMQADIFYRLQSLYYSEDHNSHESYQQFNAKLANELLRDAIFVDTQASLAQQVVDPTRPVSLSNLAISNNRADVSTASVNPYWRNHWSNRFESLLSVRAARVNYDEESNPFVSDSRINSFSLGLYSDKDAKWNLNIGLSADKIEYEGRGENEFKQGFLSVEARLQAKTTLIMTIGNESNQFETVNQESPEGSFWELGLRFTPSLRQRLEVNIGDRFFGKTGSLEWSYTGRRWDIEVQYQEDFFTDAQRRLQTGQFDLQFSETDLTQASTGVYLRQRSDLRFEYNRSRTRFSVTVFGEQREFQAVQVEDTLYGGSLIWDWRFAPRTNLITEYRQRRDELGEFTLDNRVYQLSIGLKRRLNSKANILLQLGRERLVSSLVLNSYQENWFSASLEREF